jgi:hypothetical protein
MDLLQFGSVKFQPDINIGLLCKKFNKIVGNVIWYDTFATVINKDNILCGYFGIFPKFVAGILDSVKDINLYVLCNKKLNYADYIEKCI